MDAHLDTHYSYFHQAWPMLGKVGAVIPADDPSNITGAFTLYDVTVYGTRPTTTAELTMVPLLGQCAGGSREKEDPLPVGTHVLVGFREGDPNLPFIWDVFPSVDTAIAQTVATAPHSKDTTRGYVEETDKDGNHTITLAAQKSIKVKDSAGVTLLEVIHTGATYEVHLGGDGGLKRLMTEDMVAALSSLFSAVIIVPGDGGAALKTALTTGLNGAFTTANSTVTAKGK